MRHMSFVAEGSRWGLISAGLLFGAWFVGTAPVVQATEPETADGTNQVQLHSRGDAQDIEKRLEALEKQVVTQQALKEARERTTDGMALMSISGGF